MGKIPVEVESIPLSEEGDLLIRIGDLSLILDPERNLRASFKTGEILRVSREGEEAEIIGTEGSYKISNLPPIENSEYEIEVRENKVIVKDDVGPIQIFSPKEEMTSIISTGDKTLIGTKSPYFYVLEPPERYLGVAFPISTVFSDYMIVGKGRTLEVFLERGGWTRATMGNVLEVDAGVLIHVITSSGYLQSFTLSGNLVDCSEEPGIIDIVPRRTYAIKLYKYGISFGNKLIKGYFSGISSFFDYILAWSGNKVFFFDENGKVRKKYSLESEIWLAKGEPRSFVYLTSEGAYLFEKKNVRRLEIRDPIALEVFPGGYCLANLKGEYLYSHEGEILKGNLGEPIIRVKREGDLTYFFGISNVYVFRRGKVVRKISLI